MTQSLTVAARTLLQTSVALGLLCAYSVHAEDKAPPAPTNIGEAITMGKPMTSFRLRYEGIDDDVPAHTETADAWTLRSLVGWQTAPWHNFSIAAQMINVGVLGDDYDNFDKGILERGKAAYPRIVDPDDTDINQLFVEWTGIRNTKVRLGRQSVKLDNVRFIGNVEFRQVMQVFDGIALENKGLLPDTSIYLAHFERVKQITTKYQDANVEIANIKYSFSPSESLVGYGYLVDWNGTAKPTNASNEFVSNKTFGLRLDGAHVMNPDWKVLYTAEYAKQSDYKDGVSKGPTEIDAHYSRLGLGGQYSSWYLRVDHEVLSSNDGGSAFQTPLGTNHLFQGWADLFLTTPTAGIKDTFVSFGGKVWDIQLLGEYHIIKSDEDFTTPAGIETGDKYGKELDLAVAYSYDKNWSAKVEYASFKEDDILGATTGAASRKRDTDKFWVTGMYTF